MVDKQGTISRLTKISKRNKFTIDIIKEIVQEEGRKILVLSDRIEHLNKLKEKLDKLNIYSDFYIGGTKQSKLDEATKATVILASYGMASEALDIPSLNTLIMATPRRGIEQSIGRILRKTDHKIQPLIVDIVDNLSSFVSQGLFRRTYYKRLKYNVKLIDVEENEIIGEEDITNVECKPIHAVEVDENININFID